MDVFQPPALYPANGRYESTIDVKKQFRTGMIERSSCFIDQTSDDKQDFQASVQRYSDKYSKFNKLAESNKWEPDWCRLPRELKFFHSWSAESRPNKAATKRKPAAKKSKTVKIKKETIDFIDLDTIAKIMTNDDEVDNEEAGEESGPKNQEKTKTSDDEGENEQENEEMEADEEENFEEENDYIDTYFDNGEDYNDDDGGNDDGPVY